MICCFVPRLTSCYQKVQMKVSAACEQTGSLTRRGVSAQDRSHLCCQLISLDHRAQKTPLYRLPDNYRGRNRCESLFLPCLHLPATSSFLQESPGAQRFGRQRMPWRAPENRLRSHEASEDRILAELCEPKIQRVHPIPGGDRAGAPSFVTAHQPSHSAHCRRCEPKLPGATFCTSSPGLGKEGQ